jgi:hypothetical protein
MMSFFKRLIANYHMNKQFNELSKNDDWGKKMLTYLFNDKKTFFRLTDEEKNHLKTQIETCSEEDFGDLNFDTGVYKNGELAYLMSCLRQPKSIIETDNAYQYLCDNFPSFNERNTDEDWN